MRTAYIGLGANLPSAAGPPAATLSAAVARLGFFGRVSAKSSLYFTEPIGYTEQPHFVNAVVALETEADAHGLLDTLMRIEREFGRDRRNAIPNGPRTLDLDILLFGECVIDEPALHVPHPRLAERSFVLVPLNEIAPEIAEPRSGVTVAELLRRLELSLGNAAQATMRIECTAWDSSAGKATAGK